MSLRAPPAYRGVETTFLGNSLALEVCGNYGLCPDAATRAQLARLLALYHKARALDLRAAPFRTGISQTEILRVEFPGELPVC